MVNDQCRCTRLGVEWFLCGPKVANCKSISPRRMQWHAGCNYWPDGSCFTPLVIHGHLDYSQKPPLGGRPNIKPGDRDTPNTHNRWVILFYHVWGHTWIKIHWDNIWLRAWSHMTSYCTWGSVTTLHDFGGVSGRPLGTFVWALTISWSRL